MLFDFTTRTLGTVSIDYTRPLPVIRCPECGRHGIRDGGPVTAGRHKGRYVIMHRAEQKGLRTDARDYCWTRTPAK